MSTATRDLQPVIVTPEDATAIDAFGGVVTSLRAEHTGGRYSLVDFTIDPSPHGPASHVHHEFDEIYYVLEGTLTVILDDVESGVPAGTSIFIPRGVVHTFANRGDVPARFVFLMSPGGFERCFDDLAAAMQSDGNIAPEDFARITSHYDVTITGSH